MGGGKDHGLFARDDRFGLGVDGKFQMTRASLPEAFQQEELCGSKPGRAEDVPHDRVALFLSRLG